MFPQDVDGDTQHERVAKIPQQRRRWKQSTHQL